MWWLCKQFNMGTDRKDVHACFNLHPKASIEVSTEHRNRRCGIVCIFVTNSPTLIQSLSPTLLGASAAHAARTPPIQVYPTPLNACRHDERVIASYANDALVMCSMTPC
jgi:hypothetical protein